MIKLKDMSIAQLENTRLQIEAMLKERKKERHIQLVGNLLDAVHALVKEFPSCSADIDLDCPVCNCGFEIDLLDYLKNLTLQDFLY